MIEDRSEDNSKDRRVRHQKIKISQPQKLPDTTPPSVSFLASGEALRFAAKKAANFQKLYEHDPIANFFNLDQTTDVGPHSHPAIITLLNHPCRGCPHLQLGYRPDVLRPKAEETTKTKSTDRRERGFTNQNIMDVDIKKLAPEEKVGSVLPTPMCSAQPISHRDPYTQQIHVTYRETWYRCPLYGIGYVSDHIHSLLNQVSSLQGELTTLKQEVKRLAQKP